MKGKSRKRKTTNEVDIKDIALQFIISVIASLVASIILKLLE